MGFVGYSGDICHTFNISYCGFIKFLIILHTSLDYTKAVQYLYHYCSKLDAVHGTQRGSSRANCHTVLNYAKLFSKN